MPAERRQKRQNIARIARGLDAPLAEHHNLAVSPQEAGRPAARVLIVDDDATVTELFSRILRLEGFEVWAAQSADDGLALARMHQPHAIILDLRMPLTGGLHLLRALRAVPGLEQRICPTVRRDHNRPATRSPQGVR